MLTVYQAAYENKLFIVKQMVEKDPTLVQSFDQDGRTALHWAASGSHADIVEYLMNQGAIVNNPDKDAGWSPLMIAVAAGHQDVVKLVLPLSDVNLMNESDHTALHYAASKNRIEICRLLLASGANVNPLNKHKQTPLHRAASGGYIKIMELLIAQKCRINPRDSQGNSPLHLACEEEHGDCALLLLNNNADEDRLNNNGKTPIELASKEIQSFLSKHIL